LGFFGNGGIRTVKPPPAIMLFNTFLKFHIAVSSLSVASRSFLYDLSVSKAYCITRLLTVDVCFTRRYYNQLRSLCKSHQTN
jgi:hypothetical protein